MNEERVNTFLMLNSDKFDSVSLISIKKRLLELDDSKLDNISFLKLKSPTIMLIISILVGYLGIDRFLIGDTGLGIIKLLTCGGFGFWTIIDWFLISGITKNKNLEKFMIATN